MVDLKDLRENPDKYRRGAELKGVRVDIDAILRIDEQASGRAARSLSCSGPSRMKRRKRSARSKTQPRSRRRSRAWGN